MPRNELTEHEVKSLIVVADRLEAASKALRSLTDSMQKTGVEKIEVLYTNSLLRGLRFIDVFIATLTSRYYESQGPTIPDAVRRIYRRKGNRQ
jgi:hypothetical protein